MVIGRGCQLEDITLNERVRALAGAGTGNDKVAGGHATLGAWGNDDETVSCAASVAGGSDDEAMEGCATSGARGGGWDVASEGCSPSVWLFPHSAHFACLYPSHLLGGCQCLNS